MLKHIKYFLFFALFASTPACWGMGGVITRLREVPDEFQETYQKIKTCNNLHEPNERLVTLFQRACSICGTHEQIILLASDSPCSRLLINKHGNKFAPLVCLPNFNPSKSELALELATACHELGHVLDYEWRKRIVRTRNTRPDLSPRAKEISLAEEERADRFAFRALLCDHSDEAKTAIFVELVGTIKMVLENNPGDHTEDNANPHPLPQDNLRYFLEEIYRAGVDPYALLNEGYPEIFTAMETSSKQCVTFLKEFIANDHRFKNRLKNIMDWHRFKSMFNVRAITVIIFSTLAIAGLTVGIINYFARR